MDLISRLHTSSPLIHCITHPIAINDLSLIHI